MCELNCDHPSRRDFLIQGALLLPAITISSAFGRAKSNVNPVQPINVAKGLRIFPRTAWATKAQPAGVLKPETSVKFLLVHHTAGTTNYKIEQVPIRLGRFTTSTRAKQKAGLMFAITFSLTDLAKFGKVDRGVSTRL